MAMLFVLSISKRDNQEVVYRRRTAIQWSILIFAFPFSFAKQKYGKYKKNRTEKNKEELNNSEKYYKRTLDKNQKLYRNKITKQLRNLRTNNPKEYWLFFNF
jgi:asparagine N-glycosylation enzyme membrane subunit Stt3